MADLKLCPFCGGTATLRTTGGWSGIGCSTAKCPALLLALVFRTPEEARAVWNRRATVGIAIPDAPSGRVVWALDEEQRLYEALAKRAAARAAGGVVASDANDENPHVMSALNSGWVRAPEWLLPDDMQALRRFCETCEDAQDYDVPKDRMRRLAELGVVQWCGGSRYSMTAFGQHVLDLLPEGWPRLPLNTQADHDAFSREAIERNAGVDACSVNQLSSRMCERGTKGCTTSHGVGEVKRG